MSFSRTPASPVATQPPSRFDFPGALLVAVMLDENAGRPVMDLAGIIDPDFDTLGRNADRVGLDLAMGHEERHNG